VPSLDGTLDDPEEVAENIIYHYQRDRLPEEPAIKLDDASWER
jgi:hypothetical protein